MRALLLLCGLVGLAACERERREFHPDPASGQPIVWTRLTEFQPGAGHAADTQALAASAVLDGSRYEENALALNEGQRLFDSFNCSGCHAHGGGGMGPALMDDRWLYGSEPAQIFATIVQGRPNGMPSFGGRIPAYQVWQLAAFVRSLSGLASKFAAPGRQDDMNGPPPPNSKDPEKPKSSR